MDSLLITTRARRRLEALCNDIPHAVLLVGTVGMGKKTIALSLGARVTDRAGIELIEPDEKGTIRIETIRELYKRTRSRQANRQVIVIDHAECMGIEAQNAFLKLLEEPRTGVTFILTTPTSDMLLPTIISRVQSIIIPEVSRDELQQLITARALSLHSQETAQLLFVANGRPGIMARLLDEPGYFEHYKQLMKQAKTVLAADTYERLALVGSLAKNRDEALELLEAMARIVYSQILRSPDGKLLTLAERLQLCLSRFAQNGNLRAQLTYLFASH